MWLVLAVSLVLTALAWHLSENFIAGSVQQRFDFQKREISSSIVKRLREYQAVLRGGAGLINASERVSRVEWRRYVDDLKLGQTFPGIVALGYAPQLDAGQLAAYLRGVRSAGYPDFAIVPAGVREQYAPVSFLETFETTAENAFGFDLLSEPVRRQTMAQARDSGEPAVSGRVTLSAGSGGEQAGFLMFVPVYRPGMPLATVEQRRAAISGYVFSVFRAQEFVAGAFVGDLRFIELELFDGPVSDAAHLLYDNFPQTLAAARGNVPGGADETLPLRAAQREWSLHFSMRPGYRSPFESLQPLIIAFGGLLVDVFLFVLIWSLGRRKQQLESISDALAEQVKASEALLRSAIETIGEAFAVYDEQDRLVFFNEHYRQVYRKSAPIIEIGRSFEEILRYGAEHGEYAEAIERPAAWVAERVALHRQSNSELVQRLSDGRWLKIRERKTASGHIVGFRVDVTEFYRAKEAAEAASRAKSQFLATVSHEIRTPMNGVLGMAQILLNPDVQPAEREECALAILRAGQTLLALLNDILDLSKVEAGKFELVPVAFSPVELLKEVQQLFAEPARRKQLAIRWQSELPESGRYLADAMRLRQMLSNLVGNAVKFTAQGEIVLGVAAVGGEEGEAMLEFSVDDSGIGIPESDRGDLFEPFSQVDGGVSRQFGGTGLGLSIVRNLARLMGGDAGVDSQPGAGSRFWFRVRVAAVAMSDTAHPAPSVKEGSGLPHLAGRVLVVEDDRINRMVIAGALQKIGASVRIAENGEVAVAAIDAGEPFDLILMDISMPVLDGIAATAQIRERLAERGLPCPPVVAITANAFPEDRQRCVEVGMADFLTKPVDFRELGRLLQCYLPQAAAGEPTAADAAVPHREIDVERALEIARRLLPLLIQHKFDAFAGFKELKSAVAGSASEPRIDELGELLNRMAFDQGVERLHVLVESWGRSLRE